MRLLIALMNPQCAGKVQSLAELSGWDAALSHSGVGALSLLEREPFDLLLLHACLPRVDGFGVLDALERRPPVCPPRVLFLCEPEWRDARLSCADCIAPVCTAPERLFSLLKVLSQKPLPKLAAAQKEHIVHDVDRFLNALSGMNHLKGRAYAAWLLERLVPSPLLEEQPLGALYRSCAQAFGTSPAAVERCLRVAIESVFTQGSMSGIERFFGATVDPERGKPTNRAFLLQAAQQLRLDHSFADTRSPNSSEMHHSPAAPTMV